MKYWESIETAPQDGSPVWARGWDWGREGTQRHYCWAYWEGDEWKASGPDGMLLTHLEEWMPGANP